MVERGEESATNKTIYPSRAETASTAYTILSSSQQQPNNTKKAVCRVTGTFPAVTSKHFCEGLLHLFVLLVFSFITAAHGRWIARILHILWGRFNTF